MSERYKFDRFLLDASERRLTRDGEVVRIEPKSFDLLHFLVANSGKLINKRDIVDAVWSGAVVTDNSLTRAVHQIRSALGDKADSPTYIETVPGTGYRFSAPVDRVEQSAAPAGEREANRRFRLRPTYILLLVLAAVAATLSIRQIVFQDSSQPIRRLAVLPLENLTGDPAQEYFVEGVHDSLVAELSRIASVDVISRTSVMQFRDSDLPVPVIARRLGVDAIVEGSVLRAGDNLTVTAQLIAASPERHLWANRYHRPVSELYEITTEITDEIADEIAVELTPKHRRALLAQPESVDPKAYDDYLQAQFEFAQRTPDGYRNARKLYHQAIDEDPNLAPAYAGLAHTFGSAAIFGLIEPAAGFPEARKLAEKALQIDDELLEGQLIMAGVELYWDRDPARAERILNRALDTNPSSAHAYRLLSEVYSLSNRNREALAAVDKARDLDPLVPTSQFKPVLILYLAHDYDAAIERSTAALKYYPEFWPGHWLQCISLSATGQQEKAVAACEAAVKYSHDEPMALGALGYVYALGGQRDEALRVAAKLQSMMASRYVGWASIAIIYGALGDLDRGFELLEEAWRHRDQMLVHARHAAFLDPFRGDDRFAELLASPPSEGSASDVYDRLEP